VVALGRSHGHHRAVLVTVTGQVSRPPLGRTQWPLTAFEAVFDRHSPRIYNFCYRTTGSWSQAEDLLAIVFLQAWRRRDKVQAERDTVLPWLLSIANNTCRNEQRSLRRHARLIARLQDARPPVEPDFSDNANQELDARAGNTILHDAMARLRRPRAMC